LKDGKALGQPSRLRDERRSPADDAVQRAMTKADRLTCRQHIILPQSDQR